ncbi:MAG: hypothetical protein AseanaTS_27830 [Candidatus Pelagadaptatus aseana]|uniref:substrate-binding periplasmic protein n=1 Tax=Candidatus Pelagadaptatus aseana TaxID=3120508 RepID=UPI0039B1954A
MLALLRVILLVALAQSADAAPLSAADDPRLGDLSVISIATHNYYPYYVNGEGMMSEIYLEAFEHQGISVEVKEYSVARGITEMMLHNVDAFSPGLLFIQDQQMQELVVSVPTFKIFYGWVYRGENHPDTMTDFAGTTLVTPAPIQSPTPYDRVILEKGVKQVMIDNPDRQIQMVMSGRATFASSSLLTAWIKLRELASGAIDDYGFLRFAPLDCTLTFSKTNPRTAYLKAEFEKGFNKVVEDGTYLKILQRFWGEGNVPWQVLPESIKHLGTLHFDPEKIPLPSQ